MTVCTVVTQVLRVLRPGLFPAVTEAKVGWAQIGRVVLPIGVLQTTVLVLGNTAYLYLSVSYIQMIKAGMPAMVFILSVLVGMERFCSKGAGLLMVLAVGVA